MSNYQINYYSYQYCWKHGNTAFQFEWTLDPHVTDIKLIKQTVSVRQADSNKTDGLISWPVRVSSGSFFQNPRTRMGHDLFAKINLGTAIVFIKDPSNSPSHSFKVLPREDK